jgi:hypothetical protein
VAEPKWGRMASCGRLAIGLLELLPHSRDPQTKGTQPSIQLLAAAPVACLFIAIVTMDRKVAFVVSRSGLKVWVLAAFSENEQVTGVLCVNLPVTADRQRRIGGAKGELQEEPLDPGGAHVKHTRVALRDHIGVSIFAFHIHFVAGINRRSINTPLEAVRVIGNTLQRPIRLPCATLRLGAVKLPFRSEIGVELSNVERARRNASRSANDVANASGRVAVEPRLFIVVVVFDHDGLGAVVGEDRWRAVPTEIEEGHDCTGCSIELDQVTPSDVIARV